MKKILTTILAGTLVAGAAFAADAKITLNFRSRMNAFAMTSYDNGSNTATTRDWMNWDTSSKAYAAAQDSFKFVLNGDRAGATLAMNLDAMGASGKGGFIILNEYSAWMNFPVGPGTLTLRTGAWKDGYADGNYRVKKDADAQNGEGVDFERFKLGSILSAANYDKDVKLKQLVFVDSLNASANNNAITGFADYGFNVNDNVNLNILVGGVSQNVFDKYGEKDGDDSTNVSWNSAFVSRAQVKVKDVLNAELIYKLSHATVTENKETKPKGSLYHTFGLYVMPQVLDALTLNIGGAAEVYGGDYGKDATDYFDWGVDLRARYQVMDPLSITFFTNVSGTSLKGGRAIGGENVGYDGKQGYTNVQKANHFKVAMWNNLSGRFKINDLLTATLNVGLITPLSVDDTDKNSYGPEWRVTPAVQIYAASNASLWAGVAISGSSWTVKGATDKDHSVLCVDIPVIFRVKM